MYELSLEGKTVRILSKAPNIMHRANLALQSKEQQPTADLLSVAEEARALREELEPTIIALRQRWNKVKEDVISGKHETDVVLELMNCHFLRSYTLGLAIAIFVNEIRITVSQNPLSI